MIKEEEIKNIINKWQDLYEKCNNKKAPEMYYKDGWFRILYSQNKYRRKQLEEMIINLENRYSESN